jgi:AbrB family looped-hinge helix DNA binding protein
MRTTIDGAGRVVIPKAVRGEARLEAGAELEVEFRDGRIEITPVAVPMRLTGRGFDAVVQADGSMGVLTAADVRDALERTRR